MAKSGIIAHSVLVQPNGTSEVGTDGFQFFERFL